MNVSQSLNNINEQNFDDDVTVTDVPSGHFPAIINVNLPDGSTTREITVEILQLEQSQGGTLTTNSGLYVKSPDETAVKVTVKQNGKEVASNVQNY